MSRALLVIFLIVSLFAGTAFYFSAASVCKIPLLYTIGSLDPRFGLSEEGAKAALRDAESLWEDATGLNLFSYTDNPDAFPINFLFDERQRETLVEENFRERLNTTEEMSDALRGQYEAAIAQYETMQASYETQSSEYEEKLNAYNQEVQKWNEAGGAPPEVFAELESEKDALARMQQALNTQIGEINTQAEVINTLSEQGNQLIDRFNNNVETYNDRFGESHEFTQGDYQGDQINIYQFSDPTELRLVVAHELGHALHLDHVENEKSIMYFLMGAQDLTLDISSEDLSEFERVCGDGSVWSKIGNSALFNF